MREEHSSVVLPRVTLPSGAYFETLTQAYGDYGEGDETILVCHALTGSWKLAGERKAGEPERGGARSSATAWRSTRGDTA